MISWASELLPLMPISCHFGSDAVLLTATRMKYGGLVLYL
jgi:hypothetical protein